MPTSVIPPGVEPSQGVQREGIASSRIASAYPAAPVGVPLDWARSLPPFGVCFWEPAAGPEQPLAERTGFLRNSVRRLRYWKRCFEHRAGAAAYPVQFALVGLTGMAVDLTAFTVLRGWLPLAAARALAIWLAMTWNYWLNRHVTFAAWRDVFRWRHYGLFCGSCLAGAAVNWLTSVLLCATTDWFGQSVTLAAGVGVAAGFVLNYTVSRRFVFAPRQG